MDKKYAGDPDSPNFLPASPLIDRQVLPIQVEGELKKVCAVALAHEQSPDDDLAVIARYMCSKPPRDSKAQKHDKHSSFTFQPPKPYVPDLAASSFLHSTSRLSDRAQVQQKRDRQQAAAGVVFEPMEPANPKVSKQNPSFTNTDDEALYEIRTKLDARPKTSAAACIDYTEPTSPVHSNRTTSVPSNRTTYSTPFTSAGITPAQTSKRLSQGLPNVTGNLDVEAIEATTHPKFPDDVTALDAGQAAQARAWMAEQMARRRRSSTQTPHDASGNQPLADFHPTQSRLMSATSRPMSRTGSIRNNITNGIREYIRPGSCSTASIRSTTSTRSRTRQRLTALKSKISSASLRSRGSISSRRRPGYDDGHEYFVDPDLVVNLDRPLPPLPGLDSYKERPKHIGLMMKSIISPHSSSAAAHDRDTRKVVIDNHGIERVMTNDQERRRRDSLARAVLEKMSTGSIGSVPGSPAGEITVYRQEYKVSVEGVRATRPLTAGSGGGVGGLPLCEDYQGPMNNQMLSEEGELSGRTDPGPGPRAMGGFVRKWGGRLGWGRKGKGKSVALS